MSTNSSLIDYIRQIKLIPRGCHSNYFPFRKTKTTVDMIIYLIELSIRFVLKSLNHCLLLLTNCLPREFSPIVWNCNNHSDFRNEDTNELSNNIIWRKLKRLYINNFMIKWNLWFRPNCSTELDQYNTSVIFYRVYCWKSIFLKIHFQCANLYFFMKSFFQLESPINNIT